MEFNASKLKNIQKKDVLKYMKNIFLTVLGTFILAFGTAVFILPFDLLVGGLSSFAIILNKALTFITVEQFIFILTWSLFILGLIVLGLDFCFKTLISTIVYPFAITLCSKLVSPDVFNGFFDIKNGPYSDLSLIMAAVIGGVLIGAGCAITFLGGGSTGGTDVIAFTICKIFKRLRSSVVIFCVDFAAITIGVFIFGDIIFTFLGILSSLISALVVDKIFLGGSKALVAQIITSKPNEITADIIKKLERTTTITEVTGGYTKKKTNMVMVSFTMSQYVELMSIVNRHDSLAFINIHAAHEIIGEDWTR